MTNLLLKISFLISIMGIFLLLILANFSQVSVQGKIISIKSYDDFKIILLDNNKTITCDSCQVKPNQTIQVQGKNVNYRGEKEIEALLIKNAN